MTRSIAYHGTFGSLPELVDHVRIHIAIRSVIVYGVPTGRPSVWVEADNNATPEVLMDILTEDMDLGQALERVENWVVLGA
jgi:hypothetical protein